MIRLGPEVLHDLDAALAHEWLETNGIGGFASSTPIGLNTRRYHGLLVAALDPPAKRTVLLSKLEETLVVNGTRYELSANQYPGAIHPAGHQLLKSFRLDPFPVFSWQVDGVEFTKSLFLVQNENTVVVEYFLRAQGEARKHDCSLEIRPLVAFRDYHATTHANAALNPAVVVGQGSAGIQPYPDLPTLHFANDAERIETSGEWYKNFEYRQEQLRGLESREDLYQPFTLFIDLNRRTQTAVIVSTCDRSLSETPALRSTELNRRKRLAVNGPFAQAADQFLVRRGAGKSVIAGYHWFTDWGRDTMIALPGLSLCTGQPDIARAILAEFAKHVSEGMLPNRFPDSGEQPEYNTVDATLWFFEAVRSLIAATGDYDFVFAHLFTPLADIIAHHLQGTRFGIRMEDDGLLLAGVPGTQLTWMDAKVGDRVITPRIGKPVEIQALWFNALRTMADLAVRQQVPDPYTALADRAQAAFEQSFWNAESGCLFDVVNGEIRDAAIRPNQLLAISLKHKILPSKERALQILSVVERDLLTPYGVRTLAPSDPAYQGRYEGEPAKRDACYHQGTVWPWLLGPFVDAYLEAHQQSDIAKAQASAWLEPLRSYAQGRGMGQIPEIFDGDAPHTPRGCIAQAWSVAEFLRLQQLTQKVR